MYFNPILKSVYGYSSADIIFQNLILSFIQLASTIIVSTICYRINPLKILQFFGVVFLVLITLLPFLLNNSTQYYHIFAIQAVLVFFTIGSTPADSILIKYFPVLKRITATSLLYAITRAIMYVLTSFGLVYLTEFFGHYGLLVVTFPVALGYLWAVNHYATLENVQLPKLMSIFKRKNLHTV
jgi:MHS family proline/betaine transporter-like MFS transporter